MLERSAFEGARRALSVAHVSRASLCDPFLAALPVTGASVCVLVSPAGQTTMCASNSVAERLDELQFDLGEGPCWEALATHGPVLALDIHGGRYDSWPVFAEAVRTDAIGGGVSAMFAFPLVVGSLDIGAVDLYFAEPGELNPHYVAEASALADVAAWQVLRRILEGQTADTADDDDGSPSRYTRREVHQATGMVLAQLNVTAEDASLLLRAYAFSAGRSVREIATEVVDRRLDFSSINNPDAPGLGRDHGI